MNFIIGLIFVAVVAILVIKRAKPELYKKIKDRTSGWL